jgi:hypothetical protein
VRHTTFGRATFSNFSRGVDYALLQMSSLSRMQQLKWLYCNLCTLAKLLPNSTTVHCDRDFSKNGQKRFGCSQYTIKSFLIFFHQFLINAGGFRVGSELFTKSF